MSKLAGYNIKKNIHFNQWNQKKKCIHVLYVQFEWMMNGPNKKMNANANMSFVNKKQRQKSCNASFKENSYVQSVRLFTAKEKYACKGCVYGF